MYMQSNQPYKQDSVFDGAVMGAAAGAGSMGLMRLGGASILQDANANNYIKNQASAEKNFNKIKEVGINTANDTIKASAKSPGSVNTETAEKLGKDSMKEGMRNSDAYKNYKKDKRLMKLNEKADKGLAHIQKASGKGKAMMYGGSIIAGALGGAMLDGANK